MILNDFCDLYEIIQNHSKSFKIIQNHSKSFKIIQNHSKSQFRQHINLTKITV